MKCYLVNDLGIEMELPPQSAKVIAGNFNTKLLVQEPERDFKIFFNGVEQKFKSNSALPFDFDGAGICVVDLKNLNGNIIYKVEKTTHYKINDELCQDLAEFEKHCYRCASDGKLKFSELFSNLEHGDINLLRIIDPLKGLADNKVIDDIFRAIPYSLEICSNPHQHLKMDQEILDVEFVKKITPDTLKHLAAHSEHWKAQTISGLIPKRLLAQTFDDELNIYENIFFRMVIQKAVMIVAKNEELWRQAMAQKSALVAWEHYYEFFNDYRRMKLLESIMPKLELLNEMYLSEEQEAAKKKLDRVSHDLQNICSSNFYIGLNRNIRLPLPIFPTNILTMDSRYREIYILWNKLQQVEIKNSETVENDLQNIDRAYFLYVFVLLIYGLHLTDVNFGEDSCIEFDENNFNFTANADLKFFKLNLTRELWKNTPYIKISMTAKKNYSVANPLNNEEDLNEVLERFTNFITTAAAQSKLIFNGDFEILNSDELKNIFKQKKGRDRKVNQRLEKVSRNWIDALNDAYRKKPVQQKFTIAIIPTAISLGDDENSFRSGVNRFYELMKNLAKENFSGADLTVFAVPVDVYSQFMAEIQDSALQSRLINYGERFINEDSKIFGNYKFGLVPVTMTDVNSIQRLIKIVKMHTMKNFMEWNLSEKTCPYCGSENTVKVQGNLRQCSDCKIIWGDTQCANENCKKIFKWIRPSINISKSGLKEISGWNLTLLKENIFGLTTIVDFDFEISEEDTARYIPRCPHCGFSNANEC